MLQSLRVFLLSAFFALPPAVADSLSYWERQGIININFDEPVVTRTVVDNQGETAATAADKGLELFSISGDAGHAPRVVWVDQDCLRIEPAPGTSVKTEFCLRFRPEVRYQSGRTLQQYEYRFHAPASPLVHEDLRSHANGAALVFARYQNTEEARTLSPQSPVSYTFTRLKMDDRGDFFESGETAPAVVEQAQLRHGNSFSMLRSLAAHGARWEELRQDSPLPGYVVVRPARQLPQGSIWRLTARPAEGSGIQESNLGPIYVNRFLTARLGQAGHHALAGEPANVLELTFNAMVEKSALQQAFREMRLTIDGVETTLSEDGTTRSAMVNGREVKVRYLGELEAASFSIRPDKPEALDALWDAEDNAAEVTSRQVKYQHPTAAPGMKLAIESSVPVLVECTLRGGLQGMLGLPLENEFTCRCSVTPMRPALSALVGHALPLHGSHRFELDTVNGSRVRLCLRHWSAAEAPAALQKIRQHLEQQQRRSELGVLLYNRAVVQARIKAGLATEAEMPQLPAGYERAREVYRNRDFLKPAGGRVVGTRELSLPQSGNPLVGTGRVMVDLDALCGGQPKPGMYLVEMDVEPSPAVVEAARSLGMNPAELELRHDVLVSVSDLAAFSLMERGGSSVLVLQQSDGSVVHDATVTLVSEENVGSPQPVKQGVARVSGSSQSDVLVRRGEDYCVACVAVYESQDDAEKEQGGAELRAMFWTDRELYRPGEKIYVRGFLRAVDGQNRITHSQHRELQLHFDAPDGRRLFTRVFNVDEFGAFSQELQMPEGEEDVCGQYRITVGTTRPRTLAIAHLRCEVFRRDSFRVEVEDATATVAPEELVLRLKAEDYNGMPLSNGCVKLELESPYPLECAREEVLWAGRRNYVLETSIPLAADGTAEFRKPLTAAFKESIWVHYSGSVVNAREEYKTFAEGGTYAPADVLPQLSEGGRLRLRCMHCSEVAHQGHSVRVSLLGTRRREQSLANGFSICGQQQEKVWTQWVNVPGNSTEGVQLPLEEEISRLGDDFDRSFEVLVEGRDYLGRDFAERMVYHAGLRRPRNEFAVSPGGDVPGKLVVESDVDGEMLLVVKSGAVCRAELLAIQRGRSEFMAPLQADEGGLVTMLAALLQRNAETGLLEITNQSLIETELPAPRNKLELALELPGTVRPGTQQTLSGRVTLPDGAPAQAVVTLYAVDEGLMMQSAVPDVCPALSQWRSAWMRFTSRRDWLNQVPLSPLPGVWQGEGRMADGSWKHQPWWMQEYGSSGSDAAAPMSVMGSALGAGYRNISRDSYRAKALAEVDGAWGADGATEGVAEAPQPRVRANFEPLALWRSALRTDAEGRFSTTCTMPDTLTTYRVVAVAADKGGSRFGTVTGKFTVNQPVMLTAGTPLFMSVGDKLLLPVTVTNNTAAEGSWQVQLQDAGEPQQVTLAAGASATLYFELNPQQPGTQVCRWTATGATGQDAVEGRFEVRHPSPLLKEAHHLVLEPGKGALVPQQLLAQELASAPGCRLELLVSANPLLHLQGGVDFLLNQPELPVLEYRASALLPWLLYDRLAPLCPQMAQTPPERVKATIARSIEKLLKYQNEDGGLPFWQSRGASNPWVSAHVAMVLRLAEERGHAVPRRAWYNLLAYLERTDFKDAAPLTRYEVARALQNREAQRDALKAALECSADSWWCSGSVRSDIEFLEYLRSNNEGRHEAFLRWMRTRAADYRHHSSWRSAWSLYALLTYVGDSPGAKVNAILRLPHGLALLDRGVYRVKEVASAAAFDSLRGTVYAVLRAKAQSVQTEYPGVTEHGLQMTRVYEKQGEDGIWREATEFAVGDVVRISLTCAKTREQDFNYLVLEDYLPASMEAINPAVPGQAAGLEPLNWSEYFDHREYLADRVRGFCTRWPGRDAVNLRYYARVKRAGSATAPPAQAQLFYEPQTYGLSTSARLESGN